MCVLSRHVTYHRHLLLFLPFFFSMVYTGTSARCQKCLRWYRRCQRDVEKIIVRYIQRNRERHIGSMSFVYTESLLSESAVQTRSPLLLYIFPFCLSFHHPSRPMDPGQRIKKNLTDGYLNILFSFCLCLFLISNNPFQSIVRQSLAVATLGIYIV